MEFDWKRVFINDLPWSFLPEVLLRTGIMFIVILVALRLSGKRGVKQISIFELVVIIALGSAAGDPMFYEDVGIIPAILVFVVIISLYRLVTILVAKSTRFENLIEGKALYVIREGKFSIRDFKKEGVSQDEFFAELRMNNVEHLGQVKNAIIETSGEISIFYYPDEEVRPGLPLLPDAYNLQSELIVEPDNYACTFCGNVKQLEPGISTCEICNRQIWVKAIKSKKDYLRLSNDCLRKLLNYPGSLSIYFPNFSAKVYFLPLFTSFRYSIKGLK